MERPTFDEFLKLDRPLSAIVTIPENGWVSFRATPARTLPKPESPKERKIQEALEMLVDLSIEPQSLKDALDFIAARYQIRIESDPLAEVKGSCRGIKLRSLLSILLEQCQGELAFKIDRDALKVYSKTAS